MEDHVHDGYDCHGALCVFMLELLGDELPKPLPIKVYDGIFQKFKDLSDQRLVSLVLGRHVRSWPYY